MRGAAARLSSAICGRWSAPVQPWCSRRGWEKTWQGSGFQVCRRVCSSMSAGGKLPIREENLTRSADKSATRVVNPRDCLPSAFVQDHSCLEKLGFERGSEQAPAGKRDVSVGSVVLTCNAVYHRQGWKPRTPHRESLGRRRGGRRQDGARWRVRGRWRWCMRTRTMLA